MTKPARHELEIYGAVLHVATTRKQWRAIGLRGLEKVNSTGMTQLTLWVPKQGLAVPHVSVYVDPRGLDDPRLVLVIAHEAAHAAALLLDQVDESYDGNSEALAYLAGWAAEKIWRHVKGVKP